MPDWIGWLITVAVIAALAWFAAGYELDCFFNSDYCKWMP